MRLIFDGHLDLALFALAYNRDQTESAATINQREAGMTDVPERRGAAVGLPLPVPREVASGVPPG